MLLKLVYYSLFHQIRIWWRTYGKRMKHISVGLRMDGTIDLDMLDDVDDSDDDDENEDGEVSKSSSWNCNNLSIAEAEFTIEELQNAVKRARARGFPKPLPPKAPIYPSAEYDKLEP